MAEENDYIVIQLPDWDGWRIAGSDNEWQMQRIVKGKHGETWKGTNFWPSIEFAVGAAYERTLRERGVTVDLRDVPDECRKAKEELVKAVRKAVGR